MYSFLRVYRPYVLVGLILLFVGPAYTQVDTAAVLKRLCESYLTEEKQIIADTAYVPDQQGEIFTPEMADYLRKRFLYRHILEQPTMLHPKREAIVVWEAERMGCRLTFPGSADAFADIIQTNKGFRIAGINGEIIGESQLRSTDSLLVLARSIVVEKKDLHAFVETFVRAADAYWQEGKMDSLKPLCSPEYLSILKLGQEADSLAQYKRIPWKLRSQYIDWLGGDTAVAVLDIRYHGRAIFYLEKKEGKWLVFGEQGLIGNEKNITSKRQELELLRAKASLRNTIEFTLNPALAAFFQRNNEDSLQALSSQAFMQSMEKIKWKFGKINSNFLEVDGMSFPVNLDDKVLLRNDSAWVYRLDDTVYFSQKEGKWQVLGFNQFMDKPATEAYVEANFQSLLFFWGIDYSSLNDKTADLYLPEPGEPDTMTYHYMTDFMLNEAQPQLPGGLWNYMETQMNPKQRQKAAEYAYLSFIVEKDGSLADIQILKSPNKRKGKKAMKMLEQMPKWVPAEVDNRAVKMYRVLAVPVY